MWVSEGIWLFHHEIQYIHLVQDSEKQKKDPDEGRVAADLPQMHEVNHQVGNPLCKLQSDCSFTSVAYISSKDLSCGPL